MRVDVKTATTVEVGLEDMEKRIYLTLFMQIGVKPEAKLVSTCNKDVDMAFS
jgi:hypothetical protein